MEQVEDAQDYISSILMRTIPPATPDLKDLLSLPPPDPVKMIISIYSCIPENETKRKPKGEELGTFLLSSFEGAFKLIFSNMWTDLKSGPTLAVDEAIIMPRGSYWGTLGQFGSVSPSLLVALQRLSCSLSLILSLQVRLASALSFDSALLLNSFFQNFWNPEIKQLIDMVTGGSLLHTSCSRNQWSNCLASAAVCLVAVEVVLAIEGRGSGWWEEIISPLVDNLDKNFPAALYQEYLKWEEQEKGGKGQLVGEDGLVLLSVDFLMDALHILATIAKGCGHQQLQRTISESALRVVNQSWKHIQQLTKQVPAELPVKVLYGSLSSLLFLHNQLQHLPLHSSWEKLKDELILTLGEQVRSLKEKLIQYHSTLCITCLLQDSDCSLGHTSKPFYEAERCSYTVQMWVYHVRGLEHDLRVHIPSQFQQVREAVVLAVLETCLSHLALRYSQICSAPSKTTLAIADILLIVSSVASLLSGLSVYESPLLRAVHANCHLLLFVAGAVKCSLEELHSLLAQHLQEEHGASEQRGKRDWLEVLETHQHLLLIDDIAVSVRSANMPPHPPSQLPQLLQLLLSSGCGLCVELCCHCGESNGVEVLQRTLEVVSQCPHTEWALAAIYTALVERKNSASGSCRPQLFVIHAFHSLLKRHVTPILHSFLLEKILVFCQKKQGEGELSNDILDGLGEQLCLQMPRPLLFLLYCMTDEVSNSTGLTLGERIAKVLALQLSESVLLSHFSHHLYHNLISTPATLLRFSLDPDHVSDNTSNCSPDDPPNQLPNLPSDLSDLHIKRLVEVHAEHLSEKRKELASLVLPASLTLQTDSPVDFKAMAAQELNGCTLEEHQMAVEVISSSEKGRESLKVVALALRKWWAGGVSEENHAEEDRFNPIKEYVNLAIPGSSAHRILSQQKLMAVESSMDCTGFVQSCLSHLKRDDLRLIKRVRHEWQDGVNSELQKTEQEMVEAINVLLVSVA